MARPLAAQEPATETSPAHTVEYQRDIQPLFDHYCVACHACYDAPCQLKLASSQGADRGANKTPVYNGTRTKAIAPTRLHQDALSTQAWRDKGFFGVLGADEKPDQGLLARMLTMGHESPALKDKDINRALEHKHQCPSSDQFDHYADARPLGGMPFAVTGLPQAHYNTLQRWLAQGAKTGTAQVQLSASEQTQVAAWEDYFNRTDNKSKLIARYLYEHLFLAHLYFSEPDEGAPKHFFRLVRAQHRSPAAIEPISSVRPNDDPGDSFYYRLQPIEDTLVHKTHITYALSQHRRSRFESLFDNGDWQVDNLPDYSADAAANPFVTFASIPAQSRYRFMLDEAEYFTRTFIRGPVCRGQVATDVIRDHFWIAFESPETDQFVQHASYRQAAAPYLSVPGQNGRLIEFGSEWIRYSKGREKYVELREQQQRKSFPEGPDLNHLWSANDQAFLSIFRHFDSASVLRGWWGRTPRTLWVLDYPLFERTYYELVVNFNVFGSVSHQAQTRLYFDLIRHEGESNFLRFLPADKRQAIYLHWYRGLTGIKRAIVYHKLDTSTPSAIALGPGPDSKQLLIDRLFEQYGDKLNRDDYNRCHSKSCEQQAQLRSPLARALRPIALATGKTHPGVLRLPDVTSLRILKADGSDALLQLFRNRAHSNVAYMFGERLRYRPDEDTVTILHYPLSSYINYQFTVPEAELAEFVQALLSMDTDSQQQKIAERWGVSRVAADFWEQFHASTHYMQKHRPVEAGIYDLNRYLQW